MILIGELRDSESAETALQAAESGHLVLSTMHTIDASETIARMVEFFPEGKQTQVRSILAGVLRGVVSQRLLPRRDGGRIAAFEVMVNNNRIADLVRENRPEEIPEAIADGEFFHMQTLTAALIDLVLAGEVDRDVAAGAAPNHHDFVIALEHAVKAAGRARRPATTDGRLRTPATRRRLRAPARDAPPPVRRGGRPSLAAEARGFALTEMIVVLAILVVVLTALTQLFVSASTAQVDMSKRVRGAAGRPAGARQAAARDPLRERRSPALRRPPRSSSRSARTARRTPPAADARRHVVHEGQERALPRRPTADAPYALWRYNGSTCSGTGRKEADYLTTGTVFTHGLHRRRAGGLLGTLSVDLPVDVTPADAKQRYTLKDDIVLRNTPRLMNRGRHPSSGRSRTADRR